MRLECCAGLLVTEKESVAARLVDVEAELETARCVQTQADARIEKLQQYVQVMILDWRQIQMIGVLFVSMLFCQENADKRHRVWWSRRRRTR